MSIWHNNSSGSGIRDVVITDDHHGRRIDNYFVLRDVGSSVWLWTGS